MEAQYEEISQWKPWCLENTLALLQRKFPDSAIWIVKPSRMLRSLFGCYHHFVQSSIVGIPTYSHGYGCLLHIEALLLDLIIQVHAKGQLRLPFRNVFELPLVMVGFSKGCVVLNQVVHELVNYVNPDNIHLRVPSHHCSSSSLHHPQNYAGSSSSGHRKTPSISSISSLSSMEDGPPSSSSKHGGSNNPQSPAMSKRRLESTTDPTSPSLSRTHSNSSIHRHPSISSLNSDTGERDHRDHRAGEHGSSTRHRSRSRSPMFFSRSGSSSSASQGKRVIPLTEDDILRIRQLLVRVHAMYWLDAGHSGGCGAWVVDEELLQCLAILGTSIHVHVTPQQVADPNRGWIRDEEREFVDRLRLLGAHVIEVLHFEHEERSLEKHFRVLNEF